MDAIYMYLEKMSTSISPTVAHVAAGLSGLGMWRTVPAAFCARRSPSHVPYQRHIGIMSRMASSASTTDMAARLRP